MILGKAFLRPHCELGAHKFLRAQSTETRVANCHQRRHASAIKEQCCVERVRSHSCSGVLDDTTCTCCACTCMCMCLCLCVCMSCVECGAPASKAADAEKTIQQSACSSTQECMGTSCVIEHLTLAGFGRMDCTRVHGVRAAGCVRVPARRTAPIRQSTRSSRPSACQGSAVTT